MLSQSRKEIKIEDLKNNHMEDLPVKNFMEKQETKQLKQSFNNLQANYHVNKRSKEEIEIK